MKQQTLALFIAASLTVVVQQAHAENLLQVYQQAKGYDAQLKALESNYLSILEKKPQALAALKPQVTVTGSASHTIQDTLYDAGINDTSDTVNVTNLNYSVNLGKSLYNKSLDAQVAQTDSVIAQASAGLEAGREALILRVAQAYFDFLLAQDNLQLARTEKEAIGRQLEQTRAYFDAGRSAITDVKEAESRYDLAEAQEISNVNALDLAREKLRVLTGNSYQTLNGPAGNTPLALPNPSNIDQWVRTAQASNKQLTASKYAIATAQKNVDIQRAAKKPVVDLFARQTGSASEGDPVLDPQVLGASAGVQVSMPLYTGGSIASRIREAQHSLRQAQQEYDLQARQTEQEARNAYLTVESTISQVKANQRALVSAETAAEATQAGFEVGTRTAVDVLNTLRNVFSARRDYSQSRYNYLLSTLKLKQAAGNLTDRDIQSLSNYMTVTAKQTAVSNEKLSEAASVPDETDQSAAELGKSDNYQYYAAPAGQEKKAGGKAANKVAEQQTGKAADKKAADKAAKEPAPEAPAEEQMPPTGEEQAAPQGSEAPAAAVPVPHKPGRR